MIYGLHSLKYRPNFEKLAHSIQAQGNHYLLETYYIMRHFHCNSKHDLYHLIFV